MRSTDRDDAVVGAAVELVSDDEVEGDGCTTVSKGVLSSPSGATFVTVNWMRMSSMAPSEPSGTKTSSTVLTGPSGRFTEKDVILEGMERLTRVVRRAEMLVPFKADVKMRDAL